MLQIKDASSENPFKKTSFGYGYRPSNKTPAVIKNPGPGTYDINLESPKSSGLKFQTSNRHDPAKEKLFLPGPGSYDVGSPVSNDPLKTLKTQMTMTKPPSHNTSMSPDGKGVGSLPEVRSQKSSENASDTRVEKSILKPKAPADKPIKQSYSYYSGIDTPGPGTYNVSKTSSWLYKKNVGAIIGTAERDILNLSSVTKEGIFGPSYYNYNYNDAIGKESPKAVFPKGSRPDLSGPKESSPGPGAYESEVQAEPKKPKKTFGTSERPLYKALIPKSDTPAPNQYLVSSPKSHSSIAMTKGQRPANLYGDLRVPGPGSYDIIDEFTQKKKEADKRAALSKMIQDAKSNLSETGLDFSIASLSRAKSIGASISVDPNNTLYSGVFADQSHESRRIRETYLDRVISNSPSPGPIYNVKSNTIEISKSGYKFKKDPRHPINAEEIKKNHPGPGWYDSPNDTAHKPTFPKKKRPSNVLVPEFLRKVPGPLDYETESPKQIQGGSFGKADRQLT